MDAIDKTITSFNKAVKLKEIEQMEDRLARLPDEAYEERIALRKLIIQKRLEYGLTINI